MNPTVKCKCCAWSHDLDILNCDVLWTYLQIWCVWCLIPEDMTDDCVGTTHAKIFCIDWHHRVLWLYISDKIWSTVISLKQKGNIILGYQGKQSFFFFHILILICNYLNSLPFSFSLRISKFKFIPQKDKKSRYEPFVSC